MLKCFIRARIFFTSQTEKLVPKYYETETSHSSDTDDYKLQYSEKKLNRSELMKEFVNRTSERRCVFGTIM